MLGTEAREDTLAAPGASSASTARRWNGISPGSGALSGDLGVSYAYGVPVAEL